VGVSHVWPLSQVSVLAETPSAPCISGFGFLPTRWTKKVSFPLNSGGKVTRFVPDEASKLSACGRLTVTERSAVHRVLSFGFRGFAFRVRVSCLGFRVWGSGFRVRGSGAEFLLPGFGSRILASGFRVSWFLGFGFQVSVFGFRLPGFGFRVQDSGFRG